MKLEVSCKVSGRLYGCARGSRDEGSKRNHECKSCLVQHRLVGNLPRCHFLAVVAFEALLIEKIIKTDPTCNAVPFELKYIHSVSCRMDYLLSSGHIFISARGEKFRVLKNEDIANIFIYSCRKENNQNKCTGARPIKM